MAGWNSIYRDSDRQYPTARVIRSGINLVDDLKQTAWDHRELDSALATIVIDKIRALEA